MARHRLVATIGFSLCARYKQATASCLRPAAILTALTAAMVLTAEPAGARVEGQAGAASTTNRPAAASGGISPSAPLRGEEVSATCWQEGQEILDVPGYQATEIPPDLRVNAITLRRGGDAVVLVPVADALCLVNIRQ